MPNSDQESSFPKPTGEAENAKESWVEWLANYGLEKFYDSMIYAVQGAASRCVHCGQTIYCDIVEGGGVPDWHDGTGDYGCPDSPDTNDEGTGGHEPVKFKPKPKRRR